MSSYSITRVVATFPSKSEPDTKHLVKAADTEPPVVFCSCKGYKYANTCVHVREYIAGQEENNDDQDA